MGRRLAEGSISYQENSALETDSNVGTNQMNYLPFVSWGMYGAFTAAERPIYFASWGLVRFIGIPPIMVFKSWIKKIYHIGNFGRKGIYRK